MALETRELLRESGHVNYGNTKNPSHYILESPFRPLEPLNLWTYRYPGARYPLNPWTLEPYENPLSLGPWDRWVVGTPDLRKPRLTGGVPRPSRP